MDFKKILENYRLLAENAIQEWMPAEDPRLPTLVAAMRHALEAGGKRIRPVMLLACADMFPTRAPAAPAAAALEYLHTYTLVHDDLPCMDDSPLRRGKPSVHVKFGETVAVLAGDALLTEAFHILATAYAETPEVGLSVSRILANAAGAHKLIGGQTADTLWEDQQVDAASLDYIHLNKTAALFSASLQMGAATTTADKETIKILGDIGREMGLAFQIVDDILDATSTSETLGKTASADANNGKNTYTALHGIPNSRKRVHQLTQSAKENCRKLPADSSFLQELIEQLEYRLR
jgi:geranylgeranyl pyrophosphate synthase